MAHIPRGGARTGVGGDATTGGFLDAVGLAARCGGPYQIAYDPRTQTLVVTDVTNFCARRFTPSTAEVSTAYGTCGTTGSTVSPLLFDGSHYAIAIDSHGNAYFSMSTISNGRKFKVDFNGLATDLTSGSDSRFIAADDNGNM